MNMTIKDYIAFFFSLSCIAGMLTACSSSDEDKAGKVADGIDVTHSGCLDTRGDGRDYDFEKPEPPTMVFKKDGNMVSCEWLGFWANCTTTRFVVKPNLMTASDGKDSLSILAYGETGELSAACDCPYNIYFVVRDVKTDVLHVKCSNYGYYYDGVVSFADQDSVEIKMEDYQTN